MSSLFVRVSAQSRNRASLASARADRVHDELPRPRSEVVEFVLAEVLRNGTVHRKSHANADLGGERSQLA